MTLDPRCTLTPTPSPAPGPRHAANVQRMNEDRHAAAVKLAEKHSSAAGAKLGSATSKAKADAAQENGQLGGRPKGT